MSGASLPTPAQPGGAPARSAAPDLDQPDRQEGFGWIAERLDRALDALGRLAGVLEALPDDAVSREIGEAEARLRAPGNRCAILLGSVAARRRTLAEAAALLKALGSPIDDFSRGIRTISMVAVNARVAAAGALRAGEGLELFTTDLAEMASGGAALVERLTGAHRKLTEALPRIEKRCTAIEAAHEKAAAAVAGRIETPLAFAASGRDRMARSGAEAGAAARGLAARLASAAPVLGIGETTRAWVERALAIPAHLKAFARQHQAHIDAVLHAALHQAVCRLQAEQLAQAIADFDSGSTEAASRLLDLARDVERLAGEFGHVGDDRPRAVLQPRPAALEEAALASAAVLSACAADVRGLDATCFELSINLDALFSDVKAIASVPEELRLLSLNASVKCAQLGAEGRVLSVIAAQLRDLTGELSSAGDGANMALGGAASPIAALRQGSAEHEHETGAPAIAAARFLRLVGRRFEAALGLLPEALPRITLMLTEAADALGRQHSVRRALNETQARILSLCEDELPAFSDRGAQAAEALFATLRRHCRTAPERAVHDAMALRFLPAPLAA